MEEKEFLKKWVEEAGIVEPFGSKKNQIWYNKEGDCLQLQTEQVAVVGERIDEFLTVYHSAENNDIIGFQLKDIKELVNRYGLTGIVVNASVDPDKLDISVYALLLRAFRSANLSVSREVAYSKVITTVPKESSNIRYSELAMV